MRVLYRVLNSTQRASTDAGDKHFSHCHYLGNTSKYKTTFQIFHIPYTDLSPILLEILASMG